MNGMSKIILDFPFENQMYINQYLKEIREKKRSQIKIIPMIANESISSLLKSVSTDEFDVFKIKEYNRNDLNYVAKINLARNLLVNYIIDDFLICQKGNMIYIFTSGGELFINSGINYLIKQFYPSIIMGYITSKNIFDLLTFFSDYVELDLYHKKVVRKRLFGERDTDINYKIGKQKLLFNEAFLKARSLGQWVDSIELYSDKNKFQFTLSRDGIMKVKRGQFKDIYPLLYKITEIYKEKMEFFKGRSREIQENHDLKPIHVMFEKDIFSGKQIRDQFVDIIKSYDNCTFSFIYIGNPHINVNIVDKHDYSTFTVKTYASNGIVISPQIKTTEASLIRFSKFLLDNFRESELSNFEVS
jgi:hypothetical protein